MKELQVLTILGMLFSLGYATIIVWHIGAHATFLKFWVWIGISCGILSSVIEIIQRNNIEIPVLWYGMIFLVLGAGCLVEVMMIICLWFFGHRIPQKEPDIILVLGAKINDDQITTSLKFRLDTAIVYYKKRKQRVLIIVSGGQGPDESMTEARAMKEYLVAQGVSEDDILCEDKATSTQENIKYSKDMIDLSNRSVSPTVWIVTNYFHIYRSIHLAKKQELQVEGLGCKSDPILTLSYYVRESFAVIKEWLYGNM